MSASIDLKTILRDYLLSNLHTERLKSSPSNNIISILRMKDESKCANCGKERADVEKMDVHSPKIWYYDDGFECVNKTGEQYGRYPEPFAIWCNWVCDVCFSTADVGKQWECTWLKNRGFSSNNILSFEEEETMNHVWTNSNEEF